MEVEEVFSSIHENTYKNVTKNRKRRLRQKRLNASKNRYVDNIGVSSTYHRNNTTTSLRTQIFKHVVATSPPLSRSAKRRAVRKTKKITVLTQVDLSPKHIRLPSALKKHKYYFYGTETNYLSRIIDDSKFLSAKNDFQVIDTMTGASFIGKNGDFVFTLIPRAISLLNSHKTNLLIELLNVFNDHYKTTLISGKVIVPLLEDNSSKYFTLGSYPERSRTGMGFKNPERVNPIHFWYVIKHVNECQHAVEQFIPTNLLRGVSIATKMGQWKTISKNSSIWPSISVGRNHYLNSHKDKDSFLSLSTTQSLPSNGVSYVINEAIVQYFVFPEIGLSVALRPGDLMLFNPLLYHSLSSKTEYAKELDIYSMSLYLKTAIVGENNNTQRLTEYQEEICHTM